MDHVIDGFIRIARSRKADSLRKAYARYGDNVDIVVVEDLVKGDFTDQLKGVSAVIHAATPLPGREELRDILEVSNLPAGCLIPSLRRRLSDHQGGSPEHRPSSCRRRCQAYLLRRNRRRCFGSYQPGHQGTFDRQRLELFARGCRLGTLILSTQLQRRRQSRPSGSLQKSIRS